MSIVEAETGLTAYDPQADQPFLAGGADAAAKSFDQVHDMFVAQGTTPGVGTIPATDEPRRGWRKLLGR